ncbi:hypothetical protein Nepgr_008050 [Nepenthes gracilis]|uniref:Uncharacterized protein n=1 Tax=Nepenthes gracilis TaxID=150966 RepID=A0AAD3XJ11_NEPGR|nr:hypothetical protein Nepgr_008050 [Nepenthes gracilis]
MLGNKADAAVSLCLVAMAEVLMWSLREVELRPFDGMQELHCLADCGSGVANPAPDGENAMLNVATAEGHILKQLLLDC